MRNFCTLFNVGEFESFKNILQQYCGICLSNEKEYLVLSRMEVIINKYKFSGISNLICELKNASASSPLLYDVVEAMTTPETMFFRDAKLFSYFQQTMLPNLHEQSQNTGKLRFWSAASSTGQEAYSIGMSLLDNDKAALWNYEILATDLSEKVLAKAHSGIYSKFETQRGLGEELLKKHFIAQPNDQWQANEKLRNVTRFQKYNLLEKTNNHGLFNAIFCRNVLIYFNDQTKNQVITNLCNNLQPNGYLILGGSEFIISEIPLLRKISDVPGVYQYFCG